MKIQIQYTTSIQQWVEEEKEVILKEMKKKIQGESIHSKIKEIGIKYYKNHDKYKQIKVICLKTDNKRIQKSSYIVFTTKS